MKTSIVNVKSISDKQLKRVRRIVSAMAKHSNPNARLIEEMTKGKSDDEYRHIASGIYALCYEFMVYVGMAINGKADISETEALVGKARRDIQGQNPPSGGSNVRPPP